MKVYTKEKYDEFRSLGYTDFDIKEGLAERLEDLTDWKVCWGENIKTVFEPLKIAKEDDLFLGVSTAPHKIEI